jgi:hypothetical protein
MRTPLVIAALLAVGLTACGSSDGAAATATKGDSFCKLAQAAKDDNDALDALDFTDTAKVKLQLPAAIDSLSAAVAKAPKDIVDTAKQLLTMEETVEKLLKDNDYDFAKVAASDTGKKALEDLGKSTVPDDFKKYLTDKCGIASSDTTPSDSTPTDTTPAGDTSVDTIVDLGEGADAINQFLDYYELGTSTKLTSDERSCIVDNLVDKVTGSDLNKAISGQASAELQQALGLAFINCKVTVASTP